MAKNNVIHLPVGNRLLKIKNLLRQITSQHSQTITISAIVTILFVVALINDQVLQKNGTSSVGGRGLASIEDSPASNFSLADHVVQELAKENGQVQATFAQRATALDQFAFGALEGKYVLEIYQGRIRGLQLANQNLTPTAIKDPKAFLKTAAAFMEVPSFEQIQAVLEQEFALLDDKGLAVAKVQFEFDSAQRLLSLKIAR